VNYSLRSEEHEEVGDVRGREKVLAGGQETRKGHRDTKFAERHRSPLRCPSGDRRVEVSFSNNTVG